MARPLKSAFFGQWRAAGLPDPMAHAVRREQVFASIALPVYVAAEATQAPGPMSLATLTDVYRFGAFVGMSLGRLQGLPPEHVAPRVDWCGRFNLGISLFDYVADETGGIDALLAMSPFDRLSAVAQREPTCQRPGPETRLVRTLASGVLRELGAEVGPPDRQPHADGLWQTMRDLMAAEALMSRTALGKGVDLARLHDAAKSKSAGPFRCMSEWVAVGAGPNALPRDVAAALGSSIGALYWLIDDARDLWDDLDARRWNLFLLKAAQVEPDLFDAGPDDRCEIRLSQILLRHGWVESIIAPVVDDFHAVLASMPAGPADELEVAGLHAATMERWLA